MRTSTQCIVRQWKDCFEDLLSLTNMHSEEEAEQETSEVRFPYQLLSQVAQGSGSCTAVLVDMLLLHCKDIWGSIFGVPDWGGRSHLAERGPEDTFQLQRDHVPQSP